MVEVCRTKYCHVTHDEKNTISRELKRKKKTDSGIFIVPNACNPSIHSLTIFYGNELS
jgi:hypothetical protein